MQYRVDLYAMCLGALAFMTPVAGADWDGGRDLAINERPNGSQQFLNPNATSPEWSYGYRATISGTALTLFSASAGDHEDNAGGYFMLDGWGRPNGVGPHVLVNAAPGALVINNGAGPLSPLAVNELFLHPRNDLSVAVVRWTAPFSGSFNVSANWRDLDPFGGDGGSGDIVVNGSSVFHQDWANSSGASDARTLLLQAGDRVDFVLGARDTYFFDGTGFAVRIVPEPTSAMLWLAVLAGLPRPPLKLCQL